MNEAIKQAIIEYLFNEEMKANVIASLNENIDIPFISEKTEGKMLDALYSSVEEVLKNAILKG
jgi:polysaccharide pyruvyl transferase WcaK-like protein|tara:strand:+ start:547 stop:735 length:189 start_codon:yes stop_codon:yes gene_type:complete